MTAFLAALLLLAAPAGAQTLTTINENLATSSNTMLVDTDSNRLDVGTASYTGTVPGAVLFVGSNVVVGTGTGAASEVVIYATGTIKLAGVSVSTQQGGPFASVFTGISSSCASGFHISTDTYVNGILTGGSCVADGSGGGGSSTMTITAVSDNFLGSVTGSQKNFTLSQTPANAAALTCILDGLLLSQTSDYTYTPPSTIAVTTAPAANSTGFFCNYFVNTSTLPAVFILNSSQTATGSNIFGYDGVTTTTVLGFANFDHWISSGDSTPIAPSNGVTTITIVSGQDFVMLASHTYQLRYDVRAGTTAMNVGLNVGHGSCDMTGSYAYLANFGAANTGFAEGGTSGDFTIALFQNDIAQVLPLHATTGIGSGQINFKQDYGGGNGVTFYGGQSTFFTNSSAWQTSAGIGGHYTLAGTGSPMDHLCITSSTGFYNAKMTGRTLFNAHWEIWDLGVHR